MHSLSICMIVKNEEKNLKRCLDSLKGLVNNEKVEVIIVDTGSTDNTVSIAEMYTKNIYLHEWNHNFAEMRNISINYAKGDWIMILDADEELVNPETIMNLLYDQDVFQNYNTVLVKEKNFFDSSHTDYNIIPQFRFFKNGMGFHYKGTIHNQPQYKLPVYDSEIIINHYGYVSDDAVLMKEKYERTYNMIKKELDINPTNIYLWWQLSRSSAMYSKHLDAYREIKKAFDLYNKLDKDTQINHYYLFNDYARYCFKLEYYDELVNVCLEGLKYIPVNLDLLYFIAVGYENQNRDLDCIDSLEAYVKAYEAKGYLTFLKHFPALEINLGQEEHFEKAILKLIQLLFKNKMYEKAIVYINKIENEQQKIHFLLVCLFKQNKIEEFTAKLITLNRESTIFEILNVSAEDRAKFINCCKEVAETNFDLKLLFKIPIGKKLTIEEKKKLTTINFNDTRLKNYLKLNFSNEASIIWELVQYIDLDSKTIRDVFFELRTEEKITKQSIYSFEVNLLENNIKNVNINHFLFNIYYSLLIYDLNQSNTVDNDFIKLKQYAYSFLGNFYNLSNIVRTVEYVTDNVNKFFIYLYIGQNYININKYSNAIKYYHKALEILPEFNPLVLIEINKLQGEIDKTKFTNMM